MGEIFILNIKFYIKYYIYLISNQNCSYMVNTVNKNPEHSVYRKVERVLLSLTANNEAMKALCRGLDVGWTETVFTIKSHTVVIVSSKLEHRAYVPKKENVKFIFL